MINIEEITIEDILATNWLDIVVSADRKMADKYGHLFFTEAQANSEKDEKRAWIFDFLGKVNFAHFSNETFEGPYNYLWGSISKHELDLLEGLIEHTDDPELKARLADFVFAFAKKKDYKLAKIACEAYLCSAERLFDRKTWPPYIDRITRATKLGRWLGDNSDEFKKAIEIIESRLDECNGEDPLFLSEKLMNILIDYKIDKAEKYIPLAEKAAIRAEENGDWHLARSYWDAKMKWHWLAKEEGKVNETKIKIADSFVKQGKSFLGEKPNYAIAAHWLESAIHAYRQVPGTEPIRDDIHRKLLEYEKRALQQMGGFKEELPIEDIVTNSIESVRGKEFMEALDILTRSLNWPNISRLRKEAEESSKGSIFESVFSIQYVDLEGKKIASRGSLDSSDETEKEHAIKVKMHELAGLQYQVNVMGFIEPIRRQIIREHNLTLNDFVEITHYNPFVRPGREIIYAKGLLYGFRGEFLEATCLLIPQLEDSIKFILENREVIVSGLNPDGTQMDHQLRHLLNEDALKEVLGEDLIFVLEGILLEQYSGNLRNRFAHGLMSFNDFFSIPTIYTWWLALTLCYRFYLIRLENTKKKNSPESEEHDFSNSQES